MAGSLRDGFDEGGAESADCADEAVTLGDVAAQSVAVDHCAEVDGEGGEIVAAVQKEVVVVRMHSVCGYQVKDTRERPLLHEEVAVEVIAGIIRSVEPLAEEGEAGQTAALIAIFTGEVFELLVRERSGVDLHEGSVGPNVGIGDARRRIRASGTSQT